MTDLQKEERRLLDLLRTFPQYTTDVAGDYHSLGIVSGISVIGANVWGDFVSGITSFVGGRSRQYQIVFAIGRDTALAEMCDEAQKRGADLVAGIRVDYETTKNNILVVSATGTALRAGAPPMRDHEGSKGCPDVG